ncbi:DUF4097 family beta strand repeat-containing protein [Streptomyces sp. NPDC088674]|uniref:DUF4097 family beta strand repeat-containing protein n=1 Tax=Streptomyces sp. NPDC088674 TaxID=3365869 RepID=UPI0037FB0EEE
MAEWSVAEARKLRIEDPVRTVRVGLMGGEVNVVGRPGPAAGIGLQVAEVDGPPLDVSTADGVLTVEYPDVPWRGPLKWLSSRVRERHAVVSLVVPADTHVEVHVAGAGVTVSGLDAPLVVHSVSGGATLTRLSGAVEAETVSGAFEAQATSGPLRFASVTGTLTVVDGTGPSVRADSVSGDIILDLAPGETPADIRLTSVSGQVAIRLPHPGDATVEADTASGSVSNAFEDLRVSGAWGSKKVTGRLGSGHGRLRATTVSGSLALLRRPPRAEETEPTEEPDPPAPTDQPDQPDQPDRKVL